MINVSWKRHIKDRMNPELEPAALPARLRQELQAWDAVQPLAADGSDRQFYRLKRPSSSRICLYHPCPPGDPVTENDSYYYIGRHLREQGAPVPGNFHLLPGGRLVFAGRSWEIRLCRSTIAGRLIRRRSRLLYLQALEVLIHLQIFGTPGIFTPMVF